MLTHLKCQDLINSTLTRYLNSTVQVTEHSTVENCEGLRYQQLSFRGVGNYLEAYRLVAALCVCMRPTLRLSLGLSEPNTKDTLSNLSLSSDFANLLHTTWDKTQSDYLDVCLVYRNGELQACLPLVSMYQTSDLPMRGVPTQFFESGFSFNVVPSVWPFLLSNCPTFVNQELGYEYSKACSPYFEGFFQIPTYSFSLDTDKFSCFESYLSSLSKKSRSSHRSTLKKCADLHVKIIGMTTMEGYFQTEECANLFEAYKDYWRTRDSESNKQIEDVVSKHPNPYESCFIQNSNLKIGLDLLSLYARQEGTNFYVLEVRDENKELIAINISVLRGNVLDDVVCIRDDSKTRHLSLGIYCILKMLDYALENKEKLSGTDWEISRYNLVLGTQPYKDKFIPRGDDNELDCDTILEIANFGEEHWPYQLTFAQPPFYYKGNLVNSMELKRKLFEDFINDSASLERIELNYINNGIEVDDPISYLRESIYLGEEE